MSGKAWMFGLASCDADAVTVSAAASNVWAANLEDILVLLLAGCNAQGEIKDCASGSGLVMYYWHWSFSMALGVNMLWKYTFINTVLQTIAEMTTIFPSVKRKHIGFDLKQIAHQVPLANLGYDPGLSLLCLVSAA